MSGIKHLRHRIEQGRIGKNIGVSTGLPMVDKIIFGIQKKYLYTVGADTSGGKTAFALDVFVHNLIKNRGDRKVHILYYSFEMAEDVLLARLLSRHIWEEYQEIITYEEILSLTKIISDHKLAIVNKAIPWLESIIPFLTIYDKALSPGGIYATFKEWLRLHGEFKEIGEHREEYKETDPDSLKIALLDHMGLITGQGTKKERIDLTVEYFIHFRNKCNTSGLFIQQLNRQSKSVERKTSGYELIQLDDFKDTSGTTDGSEVVFALYYPYREKIARCEGYPIQNVLKKRFRLLQILKNRNGVPDVNKGIVFYGEVGMFKELPKPADITDYAPYLDLQYETKDDDSDNVYKF